MFSGTYKKSKGKKYKKPEEGKKESVVFNHKIEIISLFDRVGIIAPTSLDKLEQVLNVLKEKKEYYEA